MASEQELKKVNPQHKEFQNLLDKDFKDRKLKENEIIKATITEITKNFIVSTNHLYAFSILTLFGILAYNKNSNIKFLFVYLIFISIILELIHIIIPVRVFQIEDLFGNFIGVILIISIYFIKNEFF